MSDRQTLLAWIDEDRERLIDFLGRFIRANGDSGLEAAVGKSEPPRIRTWPTMH